MNPDLLAFAAECSQCGRVSITDPGMTRDEAAAELGDWLDQLHNGHRWLYCPSCADHYILDDERDDR